MIIEADLLHTTGNETKDGVLTLNDIPIAPGYSIPSGTNEQILVGDGTTIDYATVVSGGQVVIFEWKFQTTVGVNNPGNGFWRADSAVGSSVVTLSIADITANTAIDISALFARVAGNWLIHIQQSNDATKFIQFTTNTVYIDHTTWWEIPVTFVQDSGFPLTNSTRCTFVFVNQNSTAGAPTITDFTNANHTHQNNAGGGTLAEAALALTDITTNNASSSKHGFLPKLPNTSTTVLDGTGNFVDIRPVSASVSGSNVTTTADTAQTITGLTLAVAANKKYRITATLFVGCNNTGGVKFAISAPSGAVGLSGVWTGSAAGVNASQVVKMQVTLSNLTGIAFVRINNSGGMAQLVGTITTSSTAGNLVLQFASGVSGETSTIFTGSTMEMIEIV